MDWWRPPLILEELISVFEREITWRSYVISFTFLAFVFVPVPFAFVLWGLLAPCCYGLYDLVLGPMPAANRWIFAAYLVLYMGLFFLLAALTFRLSNYFVRKTAKTLIQVSFLMALFSCSFLKVINEGGGMVDAQQSGSYSFWSACIHFPHSPHY